MCADGTIKINFILICSHPDTHHNINREVRHSLTWHSSESESARGRFEPVAVVMLWRDGWSTLFAPEGNDCLQRAKREDAGRFSKEGKSLDDFWYFSSLKSTIKEKLLYDSIRRQQAVPLMAPLFKKRRAKTLMLVRENFILGEQTLRESNKQKISAVFRRIFFMLLF